MNGLLAPPCCRPPLLHPCLGPVTRLSPAKTLTFRPLRLSRGVRTSPPTPRAAAQVGLLAPLSALELGLRSINLAPMRPPVAAAMSATVRWLGVYREVLLVGVLFSWFPNIPWDRQPFSALRGLSDPFLALCPDVMPPVFGRKLDLSPLVAFMAIDILIMILRPHPSM